MATTKEFTEEVLDALGARDVRVRPMFGEYGIYCDNKFLGVLCNNTMFVKITQPGETVGGDVGRGSPYPGAKPHFEIPSSRLGDSTWLYELVRVTVDALPAPKQRAKPKAKTATKETNL
ncbi:TfoX/Sxy family protein [Alpinimonas psychrophila]|uniref:TfoX/Sxy family transcriptional regulator of competence genes n=1 Tax=Alpinimonas psychrophila TaxID=748908 RepID=A0A7W3JV38_9MICO|nr:TfoX/Sxy family protein [Alpinimonas psychrophila]MBA8829794.1 TfoX/Sxy family transcriptional regulator of competence genes [Alpinimonas psychrophila]